MARCVLNLKDKCDRCLACRYIDDDSRSEELYECDECHKRQYLDELNCLPNGRMVCDNCYGKILYENRHNESYKTLYEDWVDYGN